MSSDPHELDTVKRHVRLPRALWNALDYFAAQELPGASTDDVMRLLLSDAISSDMQRRIARRAYDDELRARINPR